MPQQDYYSKWLAALSGGEANPEQKQEKKKKDYYAEWSDKLSKEPKRADFKWTSELPEAVLESSPFLAKLAAASGIPGLSQVAQSKLPQRKESIDPRKALASVTKQAQGLGELSGMAGQKKVEDYLKEKREGDQRAKRFLSYINAGGKVPLPKEGKGKSIGKVAAGVGKGVLEMGKGTIAFLPELISDFLYDPAKTIEERPVDVALAIEGAFGPRVRARARSVFAKKKAGNLTNTDIDGLAKAIAEEAPKVAPVEKPAPVAAPEPTLVSPPAVAGSAAPQAPKAKPKPKAKKAPEPIGPSGPAPGGSPIPPGMTTSEFMRASLDEINEAWARSGRELKGLNLKMVDKEGRPITMAEFYRRQRGVQAAEDFIVATTGRSAQKPTETGPKPVPPVPTATPTAPLGPKEMLLQRISQAKTMTKEQKKIIKAERGARLAAFEAATDGMTGIEKTRAFDKHFAGKHTRIQYEPFLDKMTPSAIDGLHAMVWDSKLLGKFEKRSTIEGLQSILTGVQPQKAQLEKLTRVFGSELVDALQKHSSASEKLIQLMVDVGNIPRSLMASLDMSAPFRQGLVMVSRPKQFFQAMGQMFKYFGSDESYHALLKDIVARPTYSLMRRGGLSITEVGGALGKAEEAFASRLANKVPGVKASARAYTGFLDKLRADVFDDLVAKAVKAGLDPHNNDDLIKSIASFVNTATGRGDIKAFNRAATLMNSFFFSPRLAYSRLQMMNPAWYAKQDPFVRREAIKSVLTSMGVGAATLGSAKLLGLDVSIDPRTADFMKIRSGNTRIDVFGGHSQYWRLFLNIGDQMLQKLGINKEAKGQANALDRIHRFIESKEAPVASLATDILRGKTFLGEELRLDRMVAARVIPMIAQDLYDVIKSDPDNLALILSVFGSSMFGVGAQTYETKKKKVSMY